MDEATFARLAREYGARLYVVAYRLLGHSADAEDAVQRALLKCFAARETYSSRWAISTWLYRVLTNVCIDELRRRRSRTAALRASSEIAPRHAGAGTASERVDVERALEKVPREARALLALHYVNGLSFVELARVRGISVNTVKSQLAEREPVHVVQGEQGPRLARHLGERPLDVHTFPGRARPGVTGRDLRRGAHGRLAAAAPAQLVDADVGERAVEPRRDRPARGVRFARGEALEQRALHRVLGVGGMAEQPVGDHVEPCPVFPGHPRERRFIHLPGYTRGPPARVERRPVVRSPAGFPREDRP